MNKYYLLDKEKIYELLKSLFNNKDELNDINIIKKEIKELIDSDIYYLNKVNIIKKQFHLLFIICTVLSELNIDNEIYFSILLDLIVFKFNHCQILFKKNLRLIYSEIYEKSKNIVDFYLVFYETDKSLIQNDILSIFLKGLFLEEDPINILDIDIYLNSSFRYILYCYLKNKINNILPLDLDPSILEDNYTMTVSDRYKIYEKGLRLSHIQQLCKTSNSLDIVLKNYDKMKDRILINFLQKLYNVIIENNKTDDNKLLLLKSNIDSVSMNIIKNKFPIIYSILRSFHVKENYFIYSDLDKKLLLDTIYNTVYNFINFNLNNFQSQVLSKAISENITKSLISGSFIDPYTMKVIDIKGYYFANQLKSFLEILLEKSKK